ncbi:MAG: hypothetical protein ACKPCM_00480 [Pseudanabaena sp.]
MGELPALFSCLSNQIHWDNSLSHLECDRRFLDRLQSDQYGYRDNACFPDPQGILLLD